MRRNIPWKSLIATVAAILLLAAVPGDATAASPWRTDFHKAEAEAKRSGKLLLLHFHASWCGPCRQMDHEVLKSSKLAALLGSNVIAVKVDSDRYPRVTSRFGIQGLPSDLFVQPDGKILARTSGYQPAATYLRTVSTQNSRFSRTQRAIAAHKPKPSRTTLRPVVGDRRKPDRKTAAIHLDSELKLDDSESQFAPGLGGFCPVTLWSSRKWKTGRREYAVQYKGETYYLAGSKERERFREDPRRFAPQLLGCDPVILSEQDTAVAGSTGWGAFYDGELYLFKSSQTRTRFKEDPQRYSRTRHVLREEVQRRRL